MWSGAVERKCRDFWQIYVCETKASLVAKQPPLKTLTNFFSTARYFAAAGGFTKSGARWRRNKKEKKEQNWATF